MENTNNVFSNDDKLYGKKITPVPKPEPNIGVDTQSVMLDNILGEGVASPAISMEEINNFSRISERRDMLYSMLDVMAQDTTVQAILETYAEDATEVGETGRVIWCESDDPEVTKFINYLLDTMNVDKNAYKWILSFITYGDLYLRLFRKSDMEDHIFNTQEVDKLSQLDDIKNGKKSLQEDVKINKYHKNDNYTHYVEAQANPAEMYELTKFSKTYGYIKADVTEPADANNTNSIYSGLTSNIYNFHKSDINIYEATEFVHVCMDDNVSRVEEKVNIYVSDNAADKNDEKYLYKVRRGRSILYPMYKLWRELSLIENSMLLNRVTKSAIVRLINVEVGDMDKANVGPLLMSIKNLVEQKVAINKGTGMEEYTNPGPIDNNVYVPTRNGQGALSSQQIGGDVDVKSIADVEYYQNKFFGGFRIPKQYFALTDDGAGFNGGQSLSIISSRYAKSIKRIQNAFIQGITDAVNLMLLDKDLSSYINKFTLKMLAPTTQEEVDRRDNMANKVQLTSDIMNMMEDIDSPANKLRILKTLLKTTLNDQEIFNIIDEQIEKYEKQGDMDLVPNGDEDEGGPLGGPMGGGPRPNLDGFGPESANTPASPEDETNLEPTENEEGAGDMMLPTANDLNIDLTNDEV